MWKKKRKPLICSSSSLITQIPHNPSLLLSCLDYKNLPAPQTLLLIPDPSPNPDNTFILITRFWPLSSSPTHSFPSPTHPKSISFCQQFLSWLISPNILLKVLQVGIFVVWQSHFCLNLRLFTSPLPGTLFYLPLTCVAAFPVLAFLHLVFLCLLWQGIKKHPNRPWKQEKQGI